MITLKHGLEEIVNLEYMLRYFNHEDLVKFALFCVEDCIILRYRQNLVEGVDLIKKWLKEKNVTNGELNNFIRSLSNDNSFVCSSIRNCMKAITNFSSYYASCSAENAAYAFDEVALKKQEYKNYAKLFISEDLDFPHRDFAKTFNLDDSADLNIFLDFLTDNYPAALIYSREDFLNKRICKEYLRRIFQ